MTNVRSKAILALANGTYFEGLAFGSLKQVANPQIGELVFNTSMYGYQEILTDPSYAGQIITFTSPQIGNVGCNDTDVESDKIFAQGCVVRELSPVESNFRSQYSLSSFLKKANLMGISDVDTRQITNLLRTEGSQMAALAVGTIEDVPALIEKAKAAGSMRGKTYVHEVSTSKTINWKEGSYLLDDSKFGAFTDAELATRPHCVAIDCGIKHNISRLLTDVGFRVTIVPSKATAAEIKALKPDGIFLSNGPGDPAVLTDIVDTVKDLLGEFPIFGICLGHQILGQAFGAKTFKLKFGHRGGNHPVKHIPTGRVEISVQNHGFAVASEGLAKDVTVSHVNLNDGTVEGLYSEERKAFSVQYHPESSPGPHDAQYLFKQFFDLVAGA